MKGLGPRIKELREIRKLTLIDVSKKTGIDQATLSRIENSRMIGTLDSHMRIADALGMRLPDLYSDVLNKLSEAKEKAAKQKFETFSHSSGAVAELLTTGVLQKKMMPLIVRLKASGKTASEEYPVLTERFLYIIKGSMEITLGREKRTLSQGESLYFDASESHCFRNVQKSESVCLSVMTPVSL